jgi:DNA polymerase-3 subunit delta
MKVLATDIKNKAFMRIYLLFGEERFLVQHYANSIRAAAVDPGMGQMNVEVFAGKNCDVNSALEAAETMAFMSDYRLVVMNDTGLFAAGRKVESEKLVAFLPEIPDTSIILCVETDVDKRGRLYKKTAEIGRAIEFKRLPEKDLSGWLDKLFAKDKKKISPAAARLLMNNTSGDMQLMHNEAEKLVAYAQGDKIEPADVEAVCVKSLETRIFDLVDAIGNKNPRRALEIFNNMLLMKESPIMVLAMIARQLRMVLQCKHLSGSRAPGEIATILGLRSYSVEGYLRQSRNFTEEGLIAALETTLNADFGIKTGGVGDKLAVEMLILSLAGDI